MGLGSQSLTDTEKRIFRQIVNAANSTSTGKHRLDRKLGRISKGEISRNSNVSKNIAAKVRTQIIDPFRRQNPNR